MKPKRKKKLPSAKIADAPIRIPDERSLEGRVMSPDMHCPKCGATMIEQWLKGMMMLGTPLRIKCTKCDYHNSWYGHIGEMLFMVDELPEGAYAHFKTVAIKKQYNDKKPKGKS